MNCSQVKKSGDPCKAQALEGERLCFFHSPKVAGERKQAWADGGKTTGLKIQRLIPTHLGDDAPDIALKTVQDALELAECGANWILKGKIGPQVATSLIGFIQAAMKIKELGEMELRLKQLEAKLGIDE